jgi:hypothetical protein
VIVVAAGRAGGPATEGSFSCLGDIRKRAVVVVVVEAIPAEV